MYTYMKLSTKDNKYACHFLKCCDVILCNPSLPPPTGHSPSPGTTDVLSVSIDSFAFSGISYKWNPVIGTLFWSTFFHSA